MYYFVIFLLACVKQIIVNYVITFHRNSQLLHCLAHAPSWIMPMSENPTYETYVAYMSDSRHILVTLA